MPFDDCIVDQLLDNVKIFLKIFSKIGLLPLVERCCKNATWKILAVASRKGV